VNALPISRLWCVVVQVQMERIQGIARCRLEKNEKSISRHINRKTAASDWKRMIVAAVSGVTVAAAPLPAFAMPLDIRQEADGSDGTLKNDC
jgi:hypothetical protein